MTSNTSSLLSTWKNMAAESLYREGILVSSDVRQKRIETCISCEHLSKSKYCKLCDCYMPFKTYLIPAVCDADKWPK